MGVHVVVHEGMMIVARLFWRAARAVVAVA